MMIIYLQCILYSTTTTTTTTTGRCDAVHSQTTTRTVHIKVVPVNRAPTVTTTNTTIQLVKLDSATPTTVPVITMTDPDLHYSSYKTTYGITTLPPVSAMITTTMGRFTIHPSVRTKLTFITGRGLNAKSVSIQAPLDIINEALNSLTYTCSGVDGCSVGLDTMSVIVNDEGFSGKGGALKASLVLQFQVTTDGQPAPLPTPTPVPSPKPLLSDQSSSSSSSNTTTTDTSNNDEVYIRPGSPEEGSDLYSVGSPGYRRLSFVDEDE